MKRHRLHTEVRDMHSYSRSLSVNTPPGSVISTYTNDPEEYRWSSFSGEPSRAHAAVHSLHESDMGTTNLCSWSMSGPGILDACGVCSFYDDPDFITSLTDVG